MDIKSMLEKKVQSASERIEAENVKKSQEFDSFLPMRNALKDIEKQCKGVRVSISDLSATLNFGSTYIKIYKNMGSYKIEISTGSNSRTIIPYTEEGAIESVVEEVAMHIARQKG